MEAYRVGGRGFDSQITKSFKTTENPERHCVWLGRPHGNVGPFSSRSSEKIVEQCRVQNKCLRAKHIDT